MGAGDDDEEENGEAMATWRWGASIMGGFWIPVVMHSCFPHDHGGGGGHGHDHGGHDHGQNGHNDHDHNGNHTHDDEAAAATGGDNDADAAAKTTEQRETAATETPASRRLSNDNSDFNLLSQKNLFFSQRVMNHEDDEDEYVTCLCGLIRMKNLPLFISLNIGEAFHNFTDGIFLGTAWLSCGSTMAYSIAVATILHELPNQLAGFFVMVNQNGIDPITALILNFLFGLSILLGGLFVLLFNFNDVTVGCILAIGGGTFLHVAIGELLQNAERNMTRGIQMVYMFIAFLVGAVPIGLILINHEHC